MEQRRRDPVPGGGPHPACARRRRTAHAITELDEAKRKRSTSRRLPARRPALPVPGCIVEPGESGIYVGSLDSKERTRLFAVGIEGPLRRAWLRALQSRRHGVRPGLRRGHAGTVRRAGPCRERRTSHLAGAHQPQPRPLGVFRRLTDGRAGLPDRWWLTAPTAERETNNGRSSGSIEPAERPSRTGRWRVPASICRPTAERAVHRHEGSGGDSWVVLLGRAGAHAAAHVRHHAGQLEPDLVARRNGSRSLPAARQVWPVREER